MNEPEIRLATVAEASLIADISRQAFVATFGHQNTAADIDKFLSQQFNREQLIAEVGSVNNVFLLAYSGGEIAGYVRLLENSIAPDVDAKNPMEISRFYALPSMIGKGIGKAMMQYCIALAEDLGKDVLWLGVWEKNQRAVDFYTAFGFTRFGEHGFLLGDDLQNDWLMQRLI